MNRHPVNCILAEKSNHMFGLSTDPNVKLHLSCPIPSALRSSASSSSPNRPAALIKTYSDASALNHLGSDLFISTRQLEEIINNACHSNLIPMIDCRSQMDYGSERLRHSHNVNCRAKVIARKLISKRLEEVEPSLKTLFQHSDIVVIYDKSTEKVNEEQIHSLPIYLVVQAAKRSNKKVYVVQGGFDAIKRDCPHLIECAVETSRDTDQLLPVPPTPDPIDKENLVMNEVCPRIFVGNALDAHNTQRLKEYGITHVINATPDLAFSDEQKYRCLRISVRDLPSENILQHFDQAVEFIDKALHGKSHKVLVHCSAGISRSPTLVLAYMIKKDHLTVEEALKKMRQSRSIIDPNFSFMMQLRTWEKSFLLKTDLTNDHHNASAVPIQCPNARSVSGSRYCGSSSANKKEPKSCTDAPIPVN